MQIIRDNTFQSGFRLMGTDILKTGKNAVDILDNCGTATGSPVWRLAQWGSRFSLKNETCRRTDRGFLYSDPAKRFVRIRQRERFILRSLRKKNTISRAFAEKHGHTFCWRRNLNKGIFCVI